jgi:catechol 2,3-dioxygenase
MNQPRSMPPTRRPGELGVHSLDHFALEVPDLAEAKRFYGAVGLAVRENDHTLDLYDAAQAHRWGSLVEGPAKRLAHLSFGVFADDLERFRLRLQSLDIPLLPAPPGREGDGLWVRDPDGVLVEIDVREKSSPNQKAAFSVAMVPPGQRGAIGRAAVGAVRPSRMSHLALFARDVARSTAFYCQVLGLRLADRAGDILAFLHGIHGSDHHFLALAKSERPGLHHVSWIVSSLQEVGLGAMQMAGAGYARGWGLGRHIIGSNYFHYVRDPWGSYSEYSADIDYIPAGCEWPAKDHALEDMSYLWGPVPPEDFGVNYEGVTP